MKKLFRKSSGCACLREHTKNIVRQSTTVFLLLFFSNLGRKNRCILRNLQILVFGGTSVARPERSLEYFVKIRRSPRGASCFRGRDRHHPDDHPSEILFEMALLKHLTQMQARSPDGTFSAMTFSARHSKHRSLYDHNRVDSVCQLRRNLHRRTPTTGTTFLNLTSSVSVKIERHNTNKAKTRETSVRTRNTRSAVFSDKYFRNIRHASQAT